MKKLLIIASLLLGSFLLKANDSCVVKITGEEGYILNKSDTLSINCKLNCNWDMCQWRIKILPGEYIFINMRETTIFFTISKDCYSIVSPFTEIFQITSYDEENSNRR